MNDIPPKDALPTLGASRVSIIGCGNVGTASAYALLHNPSVRELVLLDHHSDKAEGEAMDLQHAVPLGRPMQVLAGSYRDVARSALVILTAGTAGQPGESRLDLLERNVKVVHDCVGQLKAEQFQGILLVTTNPVDVLTQVAQQASGWPSSRVIGSGTVIDSARLRALLAAELAVEAQAVHGYIIGEHGDSEIAVWSAVRIAGIPLADFPQAHKLPCYDTLLTQVRQAGPEVVARKGNTCFAIASCVARICEAILRDEHTVLPVSALLTGQYGIDGLYLGTPCIIGASGIERVLELPLNEEERQGLLASAAVLRQAWADASQENLPG
jgi:L-lactate dehydrogenase